MSFLEGAAAVIRDILRSDLLRQAMRRLASEEGTDCSCLVGTLGGKSWVQGCSVDSGVEVYCWESCTGRF